ncbi:MAG: helix-turn-helix transcriptional regulator [Deltaproteobacteria bacterium]|nr:helix-turn-helix transcriptional regulator [Deltaproteobacteria bacterium]
MEGKCLIETTLAVINGKWKIRILKEISQGPVRFNQLNIRISAVSTKMLTQQLRELEANGLIVRTVFPEIPPRVEYSISDMGLSIFPLFKEMRRWGLEEDRIQKAHCTSCFQCVPYYSSTQRKNGE